MHRISIARVSIRNFPDRRRRAECSVKNGGNRPQRHGRSGAGRMELVLAGTEITSLISIKECEETCPSPLPAPASCPLPLPPETLSRRCRIRSYPRQRQQRLRSAEGFKLRKHISFILLPPARLRHSAHLLRSSILVAVFNAHRLAPPPPGFSSASELFLPRST